MNLISYPIAIAAILPCACLVAFLVGRYCRDKKAKEKSR